MRTQSLVDQVATFVKSKLSGEGTGHDWWHIYRVHHNSKLILQTEPQANSFIVEMAALLHDIVDPKVSGALTLSELRIYLENIQPSPSSGPLNNLDIEHILHIIDNISFSKNLDSAQKLSLEGQIVQDADRLDAIGAIGIARCFAYGGSRGREIYNPEIPFIKPQTKEEYRSLINGPSINHFFEKLLHLKDLMNTESARKIAQSRHQFMLNYLDQFYRECGEQAKFS